MKPDKKKVNLPAAVILYEIIGFVAIIIFLWLDEIFDLPHYLFNNIKTPVNVVESIFESIIILIIAIFCVRVSSRLLSKIKIMEGLLPICTSCKKIRDDNNHWQTIENYIESRSNASFSHCLCQECMKKLYGDQEWYQKKIKIDIKNLTIKDQINR